MKAIVCTKYGPPGVLQLQEVEKPTPGADEVLVEVHAVSINARDWHFMKGEPALARFLIGGFRKPKNPILGCDISGRVEAVGKDVTQFQPGAEVFGAVGVGGFAEYVAARESRLLSKPSNVSFEAAACIPIAGVTALQAVRDNGHVQEGQRVLINGASGGVGTFAVQLAKEFGAQVTGVCSTRNLEMARKIGADYVIDYTRQDFTRNGRQYDVIIDVAGNRSVSDYKRALTPEGICVFTGISTMSRLLLNRLMGSLASKIGSKKFVGFTAKLKREDLVFLKDLLETGKVAPVINRCYLLGETPEAMRHFGVEHAQGKIIITVDNCSHTS